LSEPLVPLRPTACTIEAPGVVDTDDSTVELLPWFGLATVVHAVPFQFMVSVWATDDPDGVS